METSTPTVIPESSSREAPAAAPVPFVFHMDNLVVSEPHSLAKGRSTSTFLSLLLHGSLIAALVIVPLFMEDLLPVPEDVLRAFFVPPLEVVPPPPPPPPVGARGATRAPAAPPPRVAEGKFTAPVEIPETIVPEESLGLDLGLDGGVPGGVEGGIPGGAPGGIVGGLPPITTPLPQAPPPRVVRVGGALTAPKLVRRVEPEYPQLAIQAHLEGMVIIEARVDTHGVVKAAQVLRGAPLFDEPALAAVRQWRYQPLLLNGQPTEFIVVVTVIFSLKTPQE